MKTFSNQIDFKLSTLLFIESIKQKRGTKLYYNLKCNCGVQFRGKKENMHELTVCRKCLNKNLRQKHGLAGTTEYNIWKNMVDRCTNFESKKNKSYLRRGIKVCDRWLKVENFYADMGKRPNNKYFIDRINNEGNYEPSNCRWVTRLQNNRNKSNHVYLTCKGETFILSEWANKVGISVGTLHRRIKKGWNIEQAIMTPVNYFKSSIRRKNENFRKSA